ncbi:MULTISPECIES: hypothetical protein [Chryseobacterium]|uniref:Transcription elongation factor, GreA/GreB, C-term n=1 Tax=Chryseobacterium salivictor TaxID=2547600 RepID=A0A4P6ZEA7_9FLAO|nr:MULTISPECIES: hypothetical protein [Chryseobacterium]MDQ0476722.1 hypothetical protein [Chryseobacterium sp. MDT2-18]QBO57891.1 hypothetical protein NBC122_01062 [Chryseobacterium salivictor]
MKRADIITIIIEKQKGVIDSLKQTVERYKTASDMDEESTHDPEDFSQQTQAKDMQLRYEKTLKEAEQNLAFLEGELKTSHDKIERGALIETDQSFLFVGISVPVFIFESKEVVTFSDHAPVFQNIKRKNKGESIEVGSKSLQIIDFC